MNEDTKNRLPNDEALLKQKNSECNSSFSKDETTTTKTDGKKKSSFNESKSSSSDSESVTWRGVSLKSLRSSKPPNWSPSVCPKEAHTVLVKVPLKSIPEPYPDRPVDVWDKDHVRMPCSLHSLSPISKTELRKRWELINAAFSKPITSSHQLEAAIHSYNTKYAQRWNFESLHYFFNTTLEEEESEYFFAQVLPQVIKLALALPETVTGAIPLLRRRRTHSITLSQRQIASLLANAFLCTFPRRNTAKSLSEYSSFPDINFNRLFSAGGRQDNIQEKLKCLINYFRRVCTKCPEGLVTFSRHHVPENQLPVWSKSKAVLPLLHVTSDGTIEDEGSGMLQLDFANKYIGGGVLGRGCVQEEIRFIICPELIVARLFTECLDDTEALIITGVERYNLYSGYGSTFRWTGNVVDRTPRDQFGRRSCVLVAIDAFNFQRASKQYSTQCIQRELNKAYAGFSWGCSNLRCVATGNWGCGAFGGDVHLKAVLQLMVAAHTHHHALVYFTFGDATLTRQLHDMHRCLQQAGVTVGLLWKMLSEYEGSVDGNDVDLFTYLHSAVARNQAPQAEKSVTKPEVDSTKAMEENDSMGLSTAEMNSILAEMDKEEEKMELDEVTEKGSEQKAAPSKGEPMEVKTYCVKSREGQELCLRKQNDSWTRIEKSKEDFTASEIVDDSPDTSFSSENASKTSKKMPGMKRKISDYFTTVQKS
ncbi:poly(ADP-ribose) glycohydrolase isoform X2 [Nilaparvata lugens]|uniref:poly(ADP-ribose) glycohydrolase isoform X1 n=1 Tax=Nilaparvata lugens TaxID=108931 RepID=UPI00193D31BB|nr:poly(ADP-ribose) glycohydrolase isoform X1 [Nilaparvata lugens]XP_039276779.1 poly(ADP-ribose) glycohydrolase isoform X2 [Nilaparvata lugens]